MAATEGTPLHEVPGWPDACVRKLADNWITTAEQVVAASATAQGVRALASHLGVSEGRMRQLVASARASLPPEVAHALEQPADTRQFGLGALKPPDEETNPRDVARAPTPSPKGERRRGKKTREDRR
jgi:hypothetical protein